MPRRTPLVTSRFYHLYNRSPHGLRIFEDAEAAQTFERTLLYYAQENPPSKLSFRHVLRDLKDNFTKLRVTLAAFVILPTHFHLLVKQEADHGISDYLRLVQNSYSHYYNHKYSSHGSIFAGRFQAKEIPSQDLTLHLSRALHRHPLTAKLTEDLVNYPYSSYKYYLNKNFPPAVNHKLILGPYLSPSDYLLFTIEDTGRTEPTELNSLLIDNFHAV